MSKSEIKEEVKEKKTRTKKETKVNKVKFDLDKQSKVKFFSKFIYILARIGKVLTIIVGIALLIGVIAAPVVSKNIKIENGNLEVFNERIHYVHDGNDIILKYNDLDIGKLSGKEANEFDKAMIDLDQVSAPAIFGAVEFYLILTLAMCVVVYLILTNVDKLFVNIYKKDTPFNEENTALIKKISYFVTALVVGPYICGIIGEILLKSKLITFEINLVYLFYILVLFSISYIFEYGYELQKDTDAKMYGDN